MKKEDKKAEKEPELESANKEEVVPEEKPETDEAPEENLPESPKEERTEDAPVAANKPKYAEGYGNNRGFGYQP